MNTTTFVSLLGMELDSIPEEQIVSPPAELEKSEVILANCSEHRVIKRLFTLASIKKAEAARIAIDMMLLASSSEEHHRLHGRRHELDEKADTLRAIFWIAIRDEFGLWGIDNIGIRHKWDIVQVTKSENDQFHDFLSHLFGGG